MIILSLTDKYFSLVAFSWLYFVFSDVQSLLRRLLFIQLHVLQNVIYNIFNGPAPDKRLTDACRRYAWKHFHDLADHSRQRLIRNTIIVQTRIQIIQDGVCIVLRCSIGIIVVISNRQIWQISIVYFNDGQK